MMDLSKLSLMSYLYDAAGGHKAATVDLGILSNVQSHRRIARNINWQTVLVEMALPVPTAGSQKGGIALVYDCGLSSAAVDFILYGPPSSTADTSTLPDPPAYDPPAPTDTGLFEGSPSPPPAPCGVCAKFIIRPADGSNVEDGFDLSADMCEEKAAVVADDINSQAGAQSMNLLEPFTLSTCQEYDGENFPFITICGVFEWLADGEALGLQFEEEDRLKAWINMIGHPDWSAAVPSASEISTSSRAAESLASAATQSLPSAATQPGTSCATQPIASTAAKPLSPCATQYTQPIASTAAKPIAPCPAESVTSSSAEPIASLGLARSPACSAQPGATQPPSAQSFAAKPKTAAESFSAKPSTPQAPTAKPSAAKPSTTQPPATQPSTAKPATTQPRAPCSAQCRTECQLSTEDEQVPHVTICGSFADLAQGQSLAGDLDGEMQQWLQLMMGGSGTAACRPAMGGYNVQAVLEPEPGNPVCITATATIPCQAALPAGDPPSAPSPPPPPSPFPPVSPSPPVLVPVCDVCVRLVIIPPADAAPPVFSFDSPLCTSSQAVVADSINSIAAAAGVPVVTPFAVTECSPAFLPPATNPTSPSAA
ncbi:hypothetical protein HYH03_012215, partial [Edaphochlamys debaryana]